MRQRRSEWIYNGKSHDKEDANYIEYKRAKRIFRKQHRRSKQKLKDEKFQEIYEAAEVDITEYFRVTKKYKRKKEQTQTLVYNEESCNTQEGICNLFSKYFKDLSMPNHDINFDSDFTDYVNIRMEQIENDSYNDQGNSDVSSTLICPFTSDELLATIKRLKSGKSPGPDGIVNEHIKYSGRSIIHHLVIFYNKIVSHEYVPKMFNVGKILPIHKGHGKRKDDPTNYRGITLTPVLSKLFERLLLNRIEEWANKSKGFPHPFQFGFRRGAGAETALFTLMESIAYYNERQSPVYCAFLDNEKAFDRVWLNGLFFKLYNFGINGKLWRLLRTIYTSMQSCVSIGGFTSNVFHVKQGVGQGRVLSAWFFTLYINDLLYSLDDLGRGLCLPWGNTPGILLADDTTLLSSSPDGLQCLLNNIYTYANRWHLKYNASKSAFLLFGNIRKSVCQCVYIGSQVLPKKENVTYAGLLLSTSKKTLERTHLICEKLRMLVNINYNHGLYFGGLNPIPAVRIWERVILPCGLFACSVWGKLSPKEYEMLEIIQRYFCKKIQGLSRRTPSVVTRDCLGLISLQAYIDQRALLFLGRLCNSDINFAFKRLFQHRLVQYELDTIKEKDDKCKMSPVYHMLSLVNKYELNNDINTYTIYSHFPSKHAWASRVKEQISVCDHIIIHAEIHSRENLKRYSLIRSPKVHRLWLLTIERPEHFYDLAYLLCLSTYSIQSDECLCGTFAFDIIKHVFMYCKKTQQQRNILVESIIDLLDVTTFSSIWNDDDDTFLSFLLGGLPTESTMAIEYNLWTNIMLRVCKTVKMWKNLLRNII